MIGTELVIYRGKLSGQWRLADTAYGARVDWTVAGWGRSHIRYFQSTPDFSNVNTDSVRIRFISDSWSVAFGGGR